MREWVKRRKQKKEIKKLTQEFSDNSLAANLYSSSSRTDVVAIGTALIQSGLSSRSVIPGMYGFLGGMKIRRMKDE